MILNLYYLTSTAPMISQSLGIAPCTHILKHFTISQDVVGEAAYSILSFCLLQNLIVTELIVTFITIKSYT